MVVPPRRFRLAVAAVSLLAASLVTSSTAAAQVVTCFGEPATIVAVAGRPTVGTAGDDVIVGTNGPDEISGIGGDDLICAMDGDDDVTGGNGADRISLGNGADTAQGGPGADAIEGGRGADTIDGGRGADTIDGNRGADVLTGNKGRDTLNGNRGQDTLNGNMGQDTLVGGGGVDLLNGGNHDDTLDGGNGDDQLFGNAGDDRLDGGPGSDECDGGLGTNELVDCELADPGPDPDPDPDPEVAPPNILLLIADDYGVESSVCYDADPGLTPRLASFCDTAVVFDRAWSSPTCSPTRAGILTGRHSFRTGIGEQVTGANGLVIGADEWTLPRVLDAAGSGYQHASFGKWHLGGELDNPNAMGWDHFSGLFGGALSDYENWTETTNGVQATVTTYSTTEIVDDALGWIDAQDDDPWLAWVAFNAPHTPFHLPPAELHTQDLDGTEEDIEADPDAYYRAAIEALDTEIGRLLDGIDPGELANTTVIFIGDNGTPQAVSSFGTGSAKGSLHEGGVQVPMMIWGAGVESSGRSDAIAGTMDLFATILDLARVDAAGVIPVDVTVDAVSLAPVLAGDDGDRSVLMTELFGTVSRANRQGRAIRNERYKLIEFTNGNVEFFDLQADPRGETPITSPSAAEAAVQAELSAALADLLAS